MPFKRSRGYEALDPKNADQDAAEDEGGKEVPTSFATKGVGWSGRDKEEDLKVVDLNERER